MTARRAVPTDILAMAAVFRAARADTARGVIAAALPLPFVGAVTADKVALARCAIGFRSRVRPFIESSGAARAAALVFVSRRPEWVVLFLAARPDPAGADGAFRLLSAIAAAAAREGAERLYASVPDAPMARETFFQAGFYSYTTETWYVASSAIGRAAARDRDVRPVTGRDAHDLFRLYLRTTPHAVQRAEQLTVADFDVDRGASALAPPHLVEGNPIAMSRGPVLAARDGEELRGLFASFRGQGAHPHVCKLRTGDGDVDLARDLLRAGAPALGADRAVACPVRPYEEHVGRALEAEGFDAIGGAMLFVKELAVRVEEPALAPAVVR